MLIVEEIDSLRKHGAFGIAKSKRSKIDLPLIRFLGVTQGRQREGKGRGNGSQVHRSLW
jgi:hypothetical protein